MGDRPRPVILPGGDLVIPGDPDELTAQVMALRAFHPASPRIRAIVAAQLRAAEDALALAHQRLHASARGSSAPSLAATPAASSGEVISTAAGAEMLGVSERHVRDLAAGNVVTGRKDARGTWWIDRESVAAYAAGRRKRRGDDREVPAGPRGRPGAGGGTAASGSP